MTSFSPNMLKTFESCPMKYYFKYIQNISMPQKSSLFEKGKKVHALANYYLKGFDISKLEKTLNEQEKSAWETLKQNQYFQKTYVNSEYNLSCKIEKYWIGGRLDAIVKQDETCYILDYKTGSIPKNPEFDYQTMVYLLCASKIYGQNLKFIYLDLKNNENCIIDFSFEKGKIYEDKIIEICAKIENTQYNAEHSKMCNFCEYKKICI